MSMTFRLSILLYLGLFETSKEKTDFDDTIYLNCRHEYIRKEVYQPGYKHSIGSENLIV